MLQSLIQQIPFQFVTRLTGSQETPPTGSAGLGISAVGFDRTLQRIRVALAVANINRVTVAHIHVGAPGQSGPIVLFLYGPAAPMDFRRPTLLTNRDFTAANLVGPLAGQPLSALAREILRGNAYVNVHTTTFPNGEIRGQLTR